MRASNRETIYSAESGDWTQARLITVSGWVRTVPMSHRDKAKPTHLHSYITRYHVIGEVWGSAVSFPCGIRGGAPAEIEFGAF